MISVYFSKKYCKDDISKIENYEKAINDKNEIWICHHRMEIREDYINTSKDLQNMNLYYNRPAEELIFLTRKEHAILHGLKFLAKFSKGMKGRKHTEETKRLIAKKTSEAQLNKPFSEFGNIFLEKFGHLPRTYEEKLIYTKNLKRFHRKRELKW